jgi:hypothetical protein
VFAHPSNKAFSLALTPIPTIPQVLPSQFATGNPFNGWRKGVHKLPSSASSSLILFKMPDPPAAGDMGTPLAPRALVAVRVGAFTIILYPIVNQSMLPHERAHAFHYNKTKLAAQNINLRLQLDALGTQLNLIATVDGTINDWFRFFYDSWFDFFKLTILSFHNTKGDIMATTTDAADPSVLLPIVNGVLATCRKKDVKFVRIQLVLNYASLVNVDPPGATVLRTEYYIELPQTSVLMTDGSGSAYNLLSFHGPMDLRMMSPAEVQAQILTSPSRMAQSFFNRQNSISLQPELTPPRCAPTLKAELLGSHRLQYGIPCS